MGQQSDISLEIQLILVPQGAEHQAVCRGLRQVINPPAVFPIPVGAIAVTAYLEKLHQSGCLIPGQAVLVMGLCGGLHPDLAVGTGVLYETCTTIAPEHAGRSIDCDRDLVAAIQQTCLYPLRTVVAVTSDRVVSRAVDKQQLVQQCQADVVDMEGFATLQRLTDWGLAVATVRVVSDDCQHDIPNLADAFDDRGWLKPVSLAIAMLKQPIAALRLIRGSTKSLKTLQTITTELCKNLV